MDNLVTTRLDTISPRAPQAAPRPSQFDGWAVLSVVGAMLLGLAISVVAAVTAAQVGVVFVIPLLLVIPLGILLLRYPFAAVILWLLVFPFVVRGTSGFGTPIYWMVHRLMIPGALWLVILSIWMGKRKREPVHLGPAEFVMGLSLLWAAGSILLLGDQPIALFIHMYDRLFIPYCMYWLIRLVAPNADDLRRLLPVALFTLLSQSIIGAISWFAPNVLPADWIGEVGERVVGTFKNPAVFTSTVLFVALLVFQYWVNSKSAFKRFLAVLVMGLAFFSVFISFSRGSWLGGILVLLGLIFVYPKLFIRLTVVGLILGLALGSTVLQSELGFAYERLNDADTAQSRVQTGAKSVRMIEQRPLFGWGYGNYNAFDDQFQVHVGDSLNEGAHTSHNTYLTIMAEQGIPALAMYLFPTVWWLLGTLTVLRRVPRRGFWSVTLLLVLWILILDHFTVSNFMDMVRYNLFGTTIFWMALALIASIVSTYAHLSPQATTRRIVRYERYYSS